MARGDGQHPPFLCSSAPRCQGLQAPQKEPPRAFGSSPALPPFPRGHARPAFERAAETLLVAKPHRLGHLFDRPLAGEALIHALEMRFAGPITRSVPPVRRFFSRLELALTAGEC